MNVDLGTVSEGTANPVPVGTVIYSVEGRWDAHGGHNAGWCKSSQSANDRVQTRVNFTMPGAPVTGFENVYPTNLVGVGVRISIWANRSYYGTPTVPTYIPLTLNANLQNDWVSGGPAYGTGFLLIRVEVIKTATNWQAGPLQFAGGNLNVSAADGASNTSTYTQVNIRGTMSTRSCSVSLGSRDLQVDMGEIRYPAGFSSREAGGYGPTTRFQLSTNCVSSPRTSIQFDPVTAASGYPNILGIPVGRSNTRGIGVQLLDATGTPIPLANPVFLVNPAHDGLNTFIFGARYFLTNDFSMVRPGRANALATYTMIYE
ncbi:type 1 fimbria pilin [Cupriavidus agavae]|uniref:Type 1 fimbria pilin n=2 Tax=Cupriavidus agavae TaxID=1001822 RepID=A0A4Q7RZ05_9BURK|nr:type 1 fimbria pilin [Cupriavidus agavae]